MPSDVLWFSTETPDRRGNGGQRRQYFQIRALAARGHRIHVVSVRSEQDDTSIREFATIERYRPYLAKEISFPGQRWLPLKRARSGRWDRLVIAHIESWWAMLQRDDRVAIPLLVDVHNVMSNWTRKLGNSYLADRYEMLERRIQDHADAVAVCSQAELDRLPDSGAARRILAPHGIDPTEWPVETAPPAPEQRVALFGSWGWEPNRRGLTWFARDVWPEVHRQLPAARCVVAGTGVPDQVAGTPGLIAPGRVDDLPAFLLRSRAVAVPVITGAGAAVKYAEAVASGIPVVATGDAATAQPGAPATVSDDADEWIAFLINRLSAEGPAYRPEQRAYARTEMNWDRAVRGMDEWLVTATRHLGAET